MIVRNLTLLTVLAPLLGCLIAGLGAKQIGRRGAQWVTIILMTVSLLSAIAVFMLVAVRGEHFYGTIYTWGISGRFHFDVGFMVDSLTAAMMVIVTFVSWVVHIYSIGYMADDSGYQRFFSYMSMFTFAMLMLVTANNFFQLFFGWEGVGLVSYLLIGFWFDKESAAAGSLKAFLVNRAGDFGFILGIAAILDYFGSLDYHTVFAGASALTQTTISVFPGAHWSIITVICILLFIGAMGKSAQMPLHVWLPESMEGPTPISALIHAATMVTAGVFLVARMSPLFELSQVALSTVLVIGATTALLTGLLAFVEFDIKRVIAFSTMSQLGYMIAADGASAYSAGIFHLLTHACFKALLFLSAGSVILALHHEQDMRKMGGLRKYLPATYITFLIGALSLAAIPPFAGFYSKDTIIEAVAHSTIPGARYAYACLLIGAFVTGYYIFRAFFMTFHTTERMSPKLKSTLKETPLNMRGPQWILSVPSVLLGAALIYWIIYRRPSLLGSSVMVLPQHNVLSAMAGGFHNVFYMTYHSLIALPFWASVLGIFFAWLTVIAAPKIPALLERRLPWLHRILVAKYGFDAFNWIVFVRGGRALANLFFRVGDLKVLDHFIVDGSGRNATRVARFMRRLQSGYLYHYVFVMILGLLAFLIWLVLA
ncbi:NADH-quinone oxidoreductase subunit L [Coxiella burnetii]|uniref:NADH-quinone oxidoreductase subunit L n=1 Tax=Coxiella burnetii TaxID=777 RepID=UPI000163A38A|nr:NADH-quinone oxidoreductase subunit L [Coxiella burnetii]ACJ17984.1 NADH-quinone oxidoreductase chain L [Coxiella burnetii CbuG_Q212]ATN66400.1 NADH-quinone oxidoreductase subunit L [Coxiella burnetii]ATN85663.1 NADH-quinone oxidoreductase subunit L [Coxiella burnetii str. Schperling]EDR36128.1 NADH dehydrogenase (ubiquinone), L subunit [Coxiella burnetii Q321]OYK80723.1 NADH-quinone oxidoreductase subunit L [Coxiella burnetii]